jgi:hypothetical protein
MEITLNLAWAAFSVMLILFWTRNSASSRVPRRTQMMALAMVVVLLLPVISLSDDLMAMQGPAETDSSVRRALHPGEGHPSVTPVSFALPEAIFDSLPLSGYSQVAVQHASLAPSLPLLARSLYSRPPPQA